MSRGKDGKINLRKDDLLFELADHKFCKTERLELTKTFQLPTLKFLIERYYTESNKRPRTEIDRHASIVSSLI